MARNSAEFEDQHLDHYFDEFRREVLAPAMKKFAAQRGKTIKDLTLDDYRQLIKQGLTIEINGRNHVLLPPAGAKELREEEFNLKDPAGLAAYRDLLLTEASAGDAWSARRLAEILELLEDQPGANQWWQRAADLGNDDAINYVEVLKERGEI